jgi:hypothetical protein
MMNSNPDRVPARELPRPADNVLLHLSVEVTLAKWARVERVEELGDVVGPKLNRSGLSSVSLAPSQYRLSRLVYVKCLFSGRKGGSPSKGL